MYTQHAESIFIVRIFFSRVRTRLSIFIGSINNKIERLRYIYFFQEQRLPEAKQREVNLLVSSIIKHV